MVPLGTCRSMALTPTRCGMSLNGRPEKSMTSGSRTTPSSLLTPGTLYGASDNAHMPTGCPPGRIEFIRVASVERNSELYLKLLVEQLHGVSLIQHDLDGRQGAVDYVFTSPSSSGAVEMTTIQDRRAAAWGSKLDDGETFECPSQRGWTVVVDLRTRLDDLRRRLPAVLAVCDRYGVTSPAQLPAAAREDADVRWFNSIGNSLYTVDGRPGTVRVQMPPVVAFPRPEGLGEDLADLLSSAAIATKLDKLRNHGGVSERHLAIGVSDIYGSGFDLLDNLKMGRRDVPDYELPDGFAATHLWLNAGGYSVLTWNRADGWAWRELRRPS